MELRQDCSNMGLQATHSGGAWLAVVGAKGPALCGRAKKQH